MPIIIMMMEMTIISMITATVGILLKIIKIAMMLINNKMITLVTKIIN